jgi:hypothetical protein
LTPIARGRFGEPPLAFQTSSRIFGFRHSARLVILARPNVEELSAAEFEFALLGVRRALYRAIF